MKSRGNGDILQRIVLKRYPICDQGNGAQKQGCGEKRYDNGKKINGRWDSEAKDH